MFVKTDLILLPAQLFNSDFVFVKVYKIFTLRSFFSFYLTPQFLCYFFIFMYQSVPLFQDIPVRTFLFGIF